MQLRERNLQARALSLLKGGSAAVKLEKALRLKAVEGCRLLTLRTHFKAVKRFSKMSSKKLESVQKVKAHLQEKCRQKALRALRTNQI